MINPNAKIIICCWSGATSINISIPINKLYMKENQFYKIKNAGLSKIKEDNIYDITEKTDVIINLILV